MTLDEIKKAVNAGKTVRWCNKLYEVVKNNGEYSIVCENGFTTGLTYKSTGQLIDRPSDFYIARRGS